MSQSLGARSVGRSVRRTPFWAQTIIGLVVGVGFGLVARWFDIGWLDGLLDQVGSIFVTLLRAVVVPLILLALIVSISRLGAVANAARLAVQTVVWFAITALIAVAIGLTLGTLTNPGTGTGLSTEGAEYAGRTGGWTDFLTGLVPSNFLGLQASTTVGDGGATTSVSFNVLQLVVIGIVLGAAALKTGSKAEPMIRLADSGLSVVQTVLWWIIRLAPIGSGALIGHAVSAYGWDLVAPLAVFTVDVYVGCLIVMFAVYPLLLKLHGLSPKAFLAGAWPAITLGFVSRSSVGTMPVTQQVTIDNLGVPREYASFAVPLGSTTKMDGCAAIYPALAAIFVAQVFNIPLGITDYLLIAFVSVVGSAATAGLTGAVVMLTLTLSTLGLPLAGVGLLLAIDPILDMMRTATNVAGQALVPVIVAKRQGILDIARYRGSNGDGLPAPATDDRAFVSAESARLTRTPASSRTPRGPSRRAGGPRVFPSAVETDRQATICSRVGTFDTERSLFANTKLIATDVTRLGLCRPRCEWVLLVSKLVQRALVLTTVSAFAAVIRARYQRWGATDADLDRVLAGDTQLAGPIHSATRAISIKAPTGQVWPWIVQLGQGRGGFYSYDWLENLVPHNDIHNADRIVPEWQDVVVGSQVRLAPEVPLQVEAVDVGRSLVLRGSVPMGTMPAPYEFTWAFVLLPQSDGTTRLVVRERYSYRQRWAGLIVQPAQLVSCLMTPKMLRGIRNRAQRPVSTAEAPGREQKSRETAARSSGRLASA